MNLLVSTMYLLDLESWHQCPYCDRISAQYSNIVAHVERRHTDVNQRLCCDAPHLEDRLRICGELCKTTSSMSKHRTKEHGGTTGKASPVVYKVPALGMVLVPGRYRYNIHLRLPPGFAWEDVPDYEKSEDESTSPYILRPVTTWDRQLSL